MIAKTDLSEVVPRMQKSHAAFLVLMKQQVFATANSGSFFTAKNLGTRRFQHALCDQ